ncbi:MAG: riboflavin synthase [Phycisphaerales bacterium]|nr:riboflavin synthase [Phycisphaerales bacterium]
MFTGLVQAVGAVTGAAHQAGGVLRLTVDARHWEHRARPGDSIAVDGCCLTVVGTSGEHDRTLDFDVVPQTLTVTTLASVQPGQRVNLEHAATPTTLLGGHIVQGHIDGVGIVEAVQRPDPGDGDYRLTISVPTETEAFMMPRGSVCVSGVSLTLAEVRNDGGLITVALIPTTLALTNLRDLSPGHGVNIEADAMTKAVVATVHRVMEQRR